MNNHKTINSVIFILSCSFFSYAVANEYPLFTGDKRLSCEAIMCLASGERPSQCRPSLKRYFEITVKRKKNWSKKKWLRKKREKRREFLELCPDAESNQYTQSVIEVLEQGEGCDAVSLNVTLSSYDMNAANRTISDRLPDNCYSYYNSAYVQVLDAQPIYVGDPERGGFWASAEEYEEKLSEYNERIAQEDLEAESTSNGTIF